MASTATNKKPSIPGPTPMKMDDYQAESDYGCLCRAAEIASDKTRLGKAMKYGEAHMMATEDFFGRVAKVTSIKGAYK